jgi:hypothetical protein
MEHAMRRIGLAFGTVVCGTWASAAWATTWDESVNGDLSNNRMAPTTLTLTAGGNTITGNFGAPDLDYVTLVVPAGYTLSAIVTGIHTGPGLSRSFIGVQAGTVMTVPPSAADATGLLGWTHFGGADGVNLLPAMSVPMFGSTGFTPPLPAGAYTFWINETLTGSSFTFDFDFQVAQVPAQDVPIPGAAWLLGVAAISLIGAARARGRS